MIEQEKVLKKKAVIYLFPLFFLFLLGGILFTQKYSDLASPKLSRADFFLTLPKGEILKSVSLGYSAAISDLLWLGVVQAIGERQQTAKGYEWLYHAADIVTTLDPKFDYAYIASGIALSGYGKRPDLSNQMLLKGVKNNPDHWQLPFYLGFNYYFYLNDYENASIYISRAASLPGHSQYLPGLAARLYVEAKNPELAIDFLNELYRQTRDENIRAQIETRIMEVMVERDILALNKAIGAYREKLKKNPGNLNDLMEKKIIEEIPKEPFGGNYFLDTKNFIAQSSTHPERLKVYRK